MDQVETPRLGYTGKIDQIRLLDFIQLSCLAQMSHHVLVQSESRSGSICVESGHVTHAAVDAVAGDGAFYEILAWESGVFHTGSLPEEQTASINKTWEYLLIEAIRYINERAAAGKADEATASQGAAQGFCGTIEFIQLTDLVQLACMARRDRIIRLECDSMEGEVYIRGGQVSHAQTGELKGEEAFCEMLRGKGGSFATLPCEGDVEQTITKPWEYLLIDGMRFLDEQSGAPDGEDEEGKKDALYQRLQRMKVSEKIHLGMTGDKESRMVLIRDGNRMVQLAIINNPRITEGEVASIAYSRNVDEEVLRRIANNREWTKLYQVRAALVKNPKTPMAVSIKMVQTLPAQDLKEISRSKSVPTAVANAARRHVMEKS